jgi:hypothetical protein
MQQTRLLLALTFGLAIIGSAAQADDKKPNILVIWGNDIGTEAPRQNKRFIDK